MRNSKNVSWFLFGAGAFDRLKELIAPRRQSSSDRAVILVDDYFRNSRLEGQLPVNEQDQLIFVSAEKEPTTDGIDALHEQVKGAGATPCAVVGIGGGCVMDSAKAVSNLLTNSGRAQDYQGWGLVKVPGVYKIGIPTLSGTGAEASRTCVMTCSETGLKLGMNSDFTIYDQLLLDPELTRTVASDQYLYTGMDNGIAISMDGKGRAIDNLFIERLWWTVKYEDVYPKAYADGIELYHGLTRYFHYYNEERGHSSLDKMTPAAVYRGTVNVH